MYVLFHLKICASKYQSPSMKTDNAPLKNRTCRVETTSSPTFLTDTVCRHMSGLIMCDCFSFSTSFSHLTMMGFSPWALQLISIFSPFVASELLGYDVIMAGTEGEKRRSIMKTNAIIADQTEQAFLMTSTTFNLHSCKCHLTLCNSEDQNTVLPQTR